MNITNPQLHAAQGANGLWTLLVSAIVEFTPEEVNSGFEFERWETLFEVDAVGADDLIMKSAALRFRPPSIRHVVESEHTPQSNRYRTRRRRDLCADIPSKLYNRFSGHKRSHPNG